MSIRDNIEKINAIKSSAAEKVGRNGNDILLCAVTKTHGAAEINEAIDAGITDIGENKVQEILDKFDDVKPVRWHLIGHLQTNKVKYIIDKVSMIHSVDSFKLAEEINKRALQHGIKMDILIQVNSANEESKFGISSAETEGLLKEILAKCDNIRVRGLMCIAPYADDPCDVAKYFREVKNLYDDFAKIEDSKLDFKYLSMGMSHDFEVAIAEGSNIIRIGTAIFGARNYNKQ